MIKTLVIPDVHGRTFWKENLSAYPVEKYPDIDIVFLGDYLDPYFHEGISRKATIEGFEEILKAAKEDKRIRLLLGNHDLSYLDTNISSSRMDVLNWNKIHKLFMENLDLFYFAHEHVYEGKRYVFTHAGINNRWLSFIKKDAEDKLSKLMLTLDKEDKEFFLGIADFNPEKDNVAELLNSMRPKNELQFLRITNMDIVSRYRGGFYNFASPIWSDIRDFMVGDENRMYDGGYQVFAHTITFPCGQYSYEINDRFAMLDASQGFTIDENGKIEPIDPEISKRNALK